MKRHRSVLTGFLGLLVLGVLFLLAGGLGAASNTAGAGTPGPSALEKKYMSGFDAFELLGGESGDDPGTHTKPKNYYPSSDDGCPVSIGENVKVNATCLNVSDGDLQGRGQAQNETAAAINPFKTSQAVAGYNQYFRGDSTCGASYSRDGGHSWQEAVVPTSFTRGTNFGGVAREYWQGGGDTAVDWDTKGNAYLLCQVFMRGPGTSTTPTSNNPDGSSGIYVFRSTGNGGGSYNFPAKPVVEQFNNPSNPLVLLDKPYMTVDNHVGSPNQDRIYVTWTDFNQDTTAKIYEAYSDDYGQTFSSPVLVSGGDGANLTLCPNSDLVNGTCDTNQDSVPFTGPDGNLYVAFNNYNGPNNSDHSQILLAKSTDGGASFGPLVKVANYYDLPDCATYQAGQDSGRLCVPEQGTQQNSVFRANNYPSGDVNPKKPNQVVVTFGSYINRHSNETTGCTPTGSNTFTGVKTPACNNDILLSVSNDGGLTFTGSTTDPRALPSVNQDAGQATSDQFWQWAQFNSDGKLAVSYLDRQYGNDETTGASDVSLSASSDLAVFKTKRVTTSSMPLPTEFLDTQGNSVFYGDYTGMSVAGSNALPAWPDTRDPDLFLCPGTGTSTTAPSVCRANEPNGLQANDQDIFADMVGLP